MRAEINEEIIKDILLHKDEKITTIHNKMYSLYEETGRDSALSAAALPPVRLTGMPSAHGNHRDLGDVLLSYQRQRYQYNEEIWKMMWELTEEEQTINRVWACFHVLPEPYYSILRKLYVENQLYRVVEAESDLSHKTFEKHRSDGINLLIRFYGSGDSVADLMRKYRNKKNSKKKQQRPAEPKPASEQLELPLDEMM